MCINKVGIALALCLASIGANAADYTAQELLRIQSETAFVKAQTDLVKAKNDLAEARGTSPSAKGMPAIAGIMRFGHETSARLVLADGSAMEVKTGDRLPDGSTVTEIRANGVRVKKDGALKDLAFVSGETTPATSTQGRVLAPFGTQ